MRITAFWTLSVTLSSFAAADPTLGYFIDPLSCKGDVPAFIEKGLAGSFKLVDAGLANEAAASDDNSPQAKLITQMFGSSSALNKNTILSRLNGLKALNNKLTESPLVGIKSQSFKIYCDESRFQKRKATITSKDMFWDSEVEEVTADQIGCLTAVAWTSNTEFSFGQIQICPWFLQKLVKDDPNFVVTKDLKQSFLTKVATGATNIIVKWIYTPVDLVSLFDKVLLHEMTHLKAGGETDDVGGFGGYGWKNCRKLGANNQGTQNADTWALYCSASDIINNQQKGVSDDGKILNTVTAKIRRAIGAVAGYWKTFTA